MADSHANFAYSTVATAPSPATSGTSLTVQTGHGARFPTVPFNASVRPNVPVNYSAAVDAEIVRVTNIAGDILTIARAQESTSAIAIAIGYQIAATITALTMTDAEDAAILPLSFVSTTRSITATDLYKRLIASGAITLTLPVGSVAKDTYYIFNNGTGVITVAGTINGDSGGYQLVNQYQWAQFTSVDGTNWIVTGGN